MKREKARREEVWIELEKASARRPNALPALSLAALKAASLSISAALLRSCRVRKLISAPCAMSAR
jgi:hypothetical protein